jgi:hypothetical protein
MYTLFDSFNSVALSRHRTLVAALRAIDRHDKRIRRYSGPHSYVTYVVKRDDGVPITRDEMLDAEAEMMATA